MPSHYLPIRRTHGFRGDLTASPDPLRSLVLRSVPLLYHHPLALSSTILQKKHKFHFPKGPHSSQENAKNLQSIDDMRITNVVSNHQRMQEGSLEPSS